MRYLVIFMLLIGQFEHLVCTQAQQLDWPTPTTNDNRRAAIRIYEQCYNAAKSFPHGDKADLEAITRAISKEFPNTDSHHTQVGFLSGKDAVAKIAAVFPGGGTRWYLGLAKQEDGWRIVGKVPFGTFDF